jgi:hypothetical protein
MQSQRIFTIEKSFWYWYFQSETIFIYHADFDKIAFRTENTSLKCTFLDAENALFEKFKGQKTVFRSENTSAKALLEFDKWLLPRRNRLQNLFDVALLIGIVNAEDELITMLFGKEVAEQSGANTADVQITSGTRSKTSTDSLWSSLYRIFTKFARAAGITSRRGKNCT